MTELEEGKVVYELADNEDEEAIGEEEDKDVEEVVSKEADGGDEETIGMGEVKDMNVEETVCLVSIVVLELLKDPPNDAVNDEVAEDEVENENIGVDKELTIRDDEAERDNVEGVNVFPSGWLLFAASKIGTTPLKAEDVGTTAGADN